MKKPIKIRVKYSFLIDGKNYWWKIEKIKETKLGNYMEHLLDAVFRESMKKYKI